MVAQQDLDAATIGDHAAIGRTIGAPLLQAFRDLDRGRYDDAIETLRRSRTVSAAATRSAINRRLQGRLPS
ncbi:hypothetical protein [Aromatoleum diolicum]|uniref:Uncharacterized protein n=1 Tax=Aromatoleum diolicum TaxID=75796 RepID=A0ABX1QAD4_9RHOO|nr:hypothetical protein [Aromatoleum diolicum]NMG75324.1 hypothetical protein [Aromatoleum diolicum]